MASDILIENSKATIVGNLEVTERENRRPSLQFDAEEANLMLGGNNADGDVMLTDHEGAQRLRLSGGSGGVASSVRALLRGDEGSLRLGGDEKTGHLEVRHAGGGTLVSLGNEEGKSDFFMLQDRSEGSRTYFQANANSIKINAPIVINPPGGDMMLVVQAGDVLVVKAGKWFNLHEKITELEERIEALEGNG